MYRTLSQHYREKFGCKVYKLAIDAGFTCPNRDGSVGRGGCTFCSGEGSGDFAEKCRENVAAQLEKAGSRAAYEQVMAAVSDFEKGNMRLSMVLASLEG